MTNQQRDRLIEELQARPEPATLARVRKATGDDRLYAHLLQEAAAHTSDAAVSSGLLTEAARTHLESLGDRSRGLILLEAALERDPNNRDARETLSAVQRRADNLPWFESILSHRAMALEERSEQDPALAERAAGAYRRLADFYEHAALDSTRAAACRHRARELSVRVPPEVAIAYHGPGVAESRRHPSGGSLVALLRQALGEIEMHDEVADGARFLLQLAMWTIHPELGLVHLFDPTAHELVVVAAQGSRASGLYGHRTPLDDRLISEALSATEATVIEEPQTDERARALRFRELHPQRSVLCAPAVLGGKCLGVLELVDPVHFARFGEGHRSAANFLATGLATYLADRLELPQAGPPSSQSGEHVGAGG